MGHQKLAEAVGDALATRGWTTETTDVMALLGAGGQRLGEAVFRGLLSMPGAFDALHFAALRQGGAVAGWLDARALGRIVPRLRPILTAAEPALVVSVFATAAARAWWGAAGGAGGGWGGGWGGVGGGRRGWRPGGRGRRRGGGGTGLRAGSW